MTRLNRFISSCALCMLLLSCAGTQAKNDRSGVEVAPPVGEGQMLEERIPGEPRNEEVPFDPKTISQALFDSTKNDVQMLIEKINGIIRDKDFNAWVSYLGDDYRAGLSDPLFLKRVSESTVIKKQKIELLDLEDYFMHVVVPSRTKDRVDDIEFIGQNRVKAFTINGKGERLRLYDLEKTEEGWKIAN